MDSPLGEGALFERRREFAGDSALEQAGFELVVPPSFSQLPGPVERGFQSARRIARAFSRGTIGSNPLSRSGQSGDRASPLGLSEKIQRTFASGTYSSNSACSSGASREVRNDLRRSCRTRCSVRLRSPLSTAAAEISSRRFRVAHHHGFCPQQLAVP